jgi:hypothetical protein
VIAHELGHVAGGHSIRIYEGAKQATAISILSLVLGAAAIAAGAGDAGMGIFAAGQQAAMGSFLAFSRTQEASADAASVKPIRVRKSRRVVSASGRSRQKVRGSAMSVVALAAIEVRCRHREIGPPLPMTIEAPPHRQRRLLFNARHPLDVAMTRLALDVRGDVLAVVEIDEVRQVVHLDPRDRALLIDQFFQQLEVGRLLLEKAMAVHADVRRRNAGMPAGSRAEMAVQTRHPEVAGVELVREGNRLRGRVALMDTDARQLAGEHRRGDCARQGRGRGRELPANHVGAPPRTRPPSRRH